MREDSSVEHIGVSEHDMTPLSNGRPRVAGSVTVVGENSERTFESFSKFV